MAEEERRYLRSKTDGYLFPFHEDIAGHPDLELISEQEAYPERHIPKHVEKVAAKGAKGVDLAKGITEETGAEKEAPTDPALAKQAAKGWPQ